MRLFAPRRRGDRRTLPAGRPAYSFMAGVFVIGFILYKEVFKCVFSVHTICLKRILVGVCVLTRCLHLAGEATSVFVYG